MTGTLYLVGTPIGNLSDISPRCREALENADFVAAEDTRVTLKLLNHLDLRKPLVSYYEHNRAASGKRITERLLAGESCALVSDAGMPAISDPGEDLVRECAALGIPVTTVPGPCALIAALVLSGLSTGRFTFEGFLSVNNRSRRAHLDSLEKERRTMIFYEAPHKLCATLRDMADRFGPDRKVTLCRELTKLHEEVFRTTFAGALERYEQEAPRGEFVLVVEGLPEEEASAEGPDPEAALLRVEALVADGMSRRDAVRQVSRETGLPKNALYRADLQRDQSPEQE